MATSFTLRSLQVPVLSPAFQSAGRPARMRFFPRNQPALQALATGRGERVLHQQRAHEESHGPRRGGVERIIGDLAIEVRFDAIEARGEITR